MTHKYQFGAFLLDAHERHLSLDGKAVHLQPKDFDVLHYLLQHPGQLASKQDIMDAVWGEVVVTENSLNRCIGKIRTALHDNAGTPEYIETIPTHGYRMICEVWKMSTAGQFKGQAANAKMTGANDSIPPAASLPSKMPRNLIFLTLASVAMVVGILAGYGFLSTEPLPVRRYSLNLGSGEFDPTRGFSTSFAISPDGSRLAYFLFENRSWNLYLRELDELEPRSMNASATRGVEIPGLTFSPDGEFLVYYDTPGLTKISVQPGSLPEVITEASNQQGQYGISWVGNEIYFVARDFSVRRMPAEGGASTPVIISGIEDVLMSIRPHALPSAEAILLPVVHGSSLRNARADVVLLNTETSETRILIIGASSPRYVASGHILFHRPGGLWAVPFDVERLQIVGEEVKLPIAIEGIDLFAFQNYTVSDYGQLIYQAAADIAPEQRVASIAQSVPVWVDRSGQEILPALDLAPAIYFDPQLSKGDERLALRIDNTALGDIRGSNIWSYDFSRGLLQRLTVDAAATNARWTPDGRQLVYRDVIAGNSRWIMPANGGGSSQSLTELPGPVGSFSPDGNTMVYMADGNLHQLTLGDKPSSKPLIESDFSLSEPSISPSGRWLAYVSTESGGWEIYVRPYPNVEDGKWQISTNQGLSPRWREDEGELYYRSTTGDGNIRTIYAVSLQTEPEFRLGLPQALFTGAFTDGGYGGSFDVTETGDRFLMLKPATGIENATAIDRVSLVIVENWFEELKRLAPPADN